MHPLPDTAGTTLPEQFNDPFRYRPHPLVQKAANIILRKVSSLGIEEGKMLGALIVRDKEGRLGYLAGFSGNIGNRNLIEGFVPPIFDLLTPDGHFKKGEAELNSINQEISELSRSEDLSSLKLQLRESESLKEDEIAKMKGMIAVSKRLRDSIRSETEDQERLAELIKESQHQKAELKRIRIRWEEKIDSLKAEIRKHEEKIQILRKKRIKMSEDLQEWIFKQYKVCNASGEESTISEIFAKEGLVPPGGTGECAAPKLLNYAYRNGLIPVAMGEFWYGPSPKTAVRTHGHFYPSCTSKCGPLLKFMLKGLEISSELRSTPKDLPVIIYEDDEIIIAEKPSGMPSVPGLDVNKSLQEQLKAIAVHRLDMDTSGIMIFARNERAASCIREQFEKHEIEKTYKARLSASETDCSEMQESGEISLPLSPDYDERPRQKVDLINGKEAITFFKRENTGNATDVIFHPITGRTHQLRVHSAHTLGLGQPIIGDLLYGGAPAPRLCLHAFSITFTHPATGERMTFSSDKLIYK
jgi:tRNA pseudouridine32 synthase/23S rRNA pseudouridine746 synthase